MKVLMTLIRRELQEHKVGFIYAPFIVTCILSLVVISVYFGITDIQTTEFNFTTEIYENEEALEWMATANSDTNNFCNKVRLGSFRATYFNHCGFCYLSF